MSFPCHLLFYLSELLFKLFKASEEPRWSWQGTRLPTSASPLPLVLLLLPHLSGPLDREDLCPGSSFLWLENWAVVGYCKLNTAAYLEDMNNYNCWGEWSCTASSMKRASHCSATDVQRDTPHPLLAKANRGNLLISKVWVLVLAEIWVIKCIFCPFINKQYFLMTELPPFPQKCFFFFFLISKYLWKRYQNSYRKISYTPNLQVLNKLDEGFMLFCF